MRSLLRFVLNLILLFACVVLKEQFCDLTKWQNGIQLIDFTSSQLYRTTMTDSCPSWPAIDSKGDLALDYKIKQFSPESLFNEFYEDPFRILESSRKRSYKMFVIVVLLAVIQGQIASSEVKELPPPRIYSTTFNDLQVTVFWNAVDSGLKDEPVLGYKVHVWETPFVPRVRYIDVDGERVRVGESPLRRKLRLQKTHYKNSTKIIEGADTPQYTQENLGLNITYEVKVQVFTNTRDGPLSQPSRFTLH